MHSSVERGMRARFPLGTLREGGSNVNKRQRKKNNAEIHSCSLCAHLCDKIRRGHGYHINKVRQYWNYDQSLKIDTWSYKFYPQFDHNSAQKALQELIEFERNMESKNESVISMDRFNSRLRVKNTGV